MQLETRSVCQNVVQTLGVESNATNPNVSATAKRLLKMPVARKYFHCAPGRAESNDQECRMTSRKPNSESRADALACEEVDEDRVGALDVISAVYVCRGDSRGRCDQLPIIGANRLPRTVKRRWSIRGGFRSIVATRVTGQSRPRTILLIAPDSELTPGVVREEVCHRRRSARNRCTDRP